MVVRLREAGARAVRRRRRLSLKLANPIAGELSDMRPSLIAGPDRGGAEATPTRGFPDSALFEVGQVFFSEAKKGRRSPPRAFGAGWPRRNRAGAVGPSPRKRLASIDAKADAFALLQALGVAVGGYRSSRAGRTGSIRAARARCNSVPRA